MNYAKVHNTELLQYPYTFTDLKHENNNSVYDERFTLPEWFAQTEAAQQGQILVEVHEVQPPAYDPVIQKIEEASPTLEKGVWKKQWRVVSLFVEYTDDAGVVHTVAEQEASAKMQELRKRIVELTQQRLDTFASTRGYDSILSAATYATSTVAKFKAEGQYCVEARDAIWAKLYEILSEVEAGTRPAPASFEEVEAELPVLTWPV